MLYLLVAGKIYVLSEYAVFMLLFEYTEINKLVNYLKNSKNFFYTLFYGITWQYSVSV